MDWRAAGKKDSVPMVEQEDGHAVESGAPTGGSEKLSGRIVLMMPALNEEQSLPHVLADLAQLQQQTLV